MRPYILAETNWKEVKSQKYSLAVLPWGATEAHNYHLPYATDNIQCDFIAARSAEIAWEQGARPIVLPTVPFGVNSGQMDIPLCLNMNPSTQLALLMDLVQVLANHDIDKLVILNGHGGNNFKSMIRELSVHYPEVFVCSLNWFQASPQDDIFAEPGDHAGEMETSCIMHIAPQWVLDLSEAGNGAAKRFKPEGLRKGWVTAQRAWTQVTEDTGVGNPKQATAEKGEIYLEQSAQEIAKFLVEMSSLKNHQLYH
ncbi:MAG: amidase [Cyclobacteriaceae bacterium]|nr:MAG: amidase [Cyclobacteriaceae bacterium]